MRALGIVLVAVGAVWPARAWWRWLIAGAGGTSLVWSTRDASFWSSTRWWAAAGAVVLAVLLAACARPLQRALATPAVPWLALGWAAVAVYGCVPETGQMAEVGVLLACGGVAELVQRRAVPTPLVAAGGALVLWSGLFGATGRQSALVGALFAVATVVWVPVATRAWSSLRLAAEPWRWAVAALAAGAAVGMARTGGIEPAGGPAVLAAAGWAVVLAATTWLVALAAPRRSG